MENEDVFVANEIRNLQNFIKVQVINDEMGDISDQAINKTIQCIFAVLKANQLEEISRIKEEYCQRALEDQQKLLAQFSGILDKAVTALTYKGPLG